MNSSDELSEMKVRNLVVHSKHFVFHQWSAQNAVETLKAVMKSDLKCSKDLWTKKALYGSLVYVKWPGVLERHEALVNWCYHLYTQQGDISLPKMFMPNAFKKDTSKLQRSWMLPVKVVAVQSKCSLSSKFSTNFESVQKTCTHVLSTSRKHTTGFLVKTLGSAAEVRCWRTPVKFVCVDGVKQQPYAVVVGFRHVGVCCHLLTS